MAAFTQRTPDEIDAALNQALQRMPWANRAQLVNEALARYLKMPTTVRYLHTAPQRLTDLVALNLLAAGDAAHLAGIAADPGRQIAIVAERREHGSMLAAILLNEARLARPGAIRSQVLRDDTTAYAAAPPLIDTTLPTDADLAVERVVRSLAAASHGDDDQKLRVIDLLIYDAPAADRALLNRDVHRALRTVRRIGVSTIWVLSPGIEERLLVNMYAIVRIDARGRCTLEGPSDRASGLSARVRRICAEVAREALPELQRRVSEEWSRHVSWGLLVHATGDFTVEQADVVHPARYPSLFVVFDPGWTEEDLRAALERRWAVEIERMNDYPVDDDA